MHRNDRPERALQKSEHLAGESICSGERIGVDLRRLYIGTPATATTSAKLFFFPSTFLPMSNGLEQRLEAVVREAAARAFGLDGEGFDAVIRPSKHADFQINGALPFAKQLGRPPREVAEALVTALGDGDGMLESTEVAGPGFINCLLTTSYLAAVLAEIRSNDRLGISLAEPHTWVVDYAAPNIAKSMHVGHLRTAIIGDAFVRMLTTTGHNVIRQDHQGDWGTQFGMLIEHLIDSGNPQATAAAAVHDLNALYRAARVKFDSDEAFAQRARKRVVALQSGDDETMELWMTLVETSRQHFVESYERIGVLLRAEDARGESFYNDMLEDTVAELEAKGLAKVDDGALCVYPPGFTGRDGRPFPFIIRKSDGGYNYATTDLATVRYSVDTLQGDRLLYVTDVRQSQHFAMVFAVCREAGWLGDDVDTTHVGYGTVLGADGKPFKTRSGETVELAALVDEAIERAEQAMGERTADASPEERRRLAHAVGVGAVKWFDLKNEHTTNYVFDFDRMLAFSGNTGPYVQYASTRAKSVIRRAGVDAAAAPIVLTEPAEKALALTLPGLGNAVDHVLAEFEPHHLCSYLFELADRFTSFYESCPVLNAAPDVRDSRLALCALTSQIIDTGLDLLGIEPVDQM